MRMQIASWIATSCLTLSVCTQSVSAGQLWDSMLNSRRPTAYPIGAPTPVTQNYASVVANYGSYAAQPPSATGWSAIPFGVPQTTAAYLPTASYDTTWNQIPVTYYRPVTSFDPRNGTTVTSLQPCTSVQYQAQRPPMIAPRPLLGEYGMQANRWPGITGPGYNPTGLAYSAGYPGFQQLPNGGYANPGYTSGVTYPQNGLAPYGNSGGSMGMPASSLPVTTIPAYAPNTYAAMPVYSQPSNTFVPATSIVPSSPTIPYSSSYQSYPSYSNSAVVPAASWSSNAYQPSLSTPSASTCANGYCTQPTTGAMPSANPNTYANGYSGAPNTPGAPNIPGATVTPLGPPVYSPAPPASPNYGNPAPAGSIMPPGVGAGNPAGFDPESMRQPSLNGQASAQRAAMDHFVSGGTGANNGAGTGSNGASATTDILPKQPASTTPNDSAFAMKEIDRPTASLLPRRDFSGASSFLSPSYTNSTSIPETLTTGKPASNENDGFGTGGAKNRVAPLEAPAGIDTRARKNPSLYDGDDPIANRSTNRSTPRIVTLDGSEDATMRLVSGTNQANQSKGMPKKSQQPDISFRPRLAPEK